MSSSNLDIHINLPTSGTNRATLDFRQFPYKGKPSSGVNSKYYKAVLNDLAFKIPLLLSTKLQVENVYFLAEYVDQQFFDFVDEILSELARNTIVNDRTKIRLSTIPQVLDGDFFKKLSSANINCLIYRNLSFMQEILNKLKTGFDDKLVKESILEAKKNIEHVGVELIYAIEQEDNFRKELEVIKELQPNHISAYPANLRKKESKILDLVKSITRKNRTANPELRERTNQVLNKTLEFLGYQQYHIYHFSNQKNFRYKLYDFTENNYLGLGVAAVTRFINDEGKRVHIVNIDDSNKYTKLSLSGQNLSAYSKEMSFRKCIHEYIANNLKTVRGLSKSEFKELFGLEIDILLPGLLEALTKYNYLENGKDIIRFTEKGIVVAENLIESFKCTEHAMKRALR